MRKRGVERDPSEEESESGPGEEVRGLSMEESGPSEDDRDQSESK